MCPECLLGSLCFFWRQEGLPVGDSEMPPFAAKSVKPSVPHRNLQQIQMQPDCRIVSLIFPHCGGRKIIEIRGHQDRTIPDIDEGGIDGNAPAMHRAGASVWVGDEI